MADSSKTIEILKELREICRDGQNGYRECAEKVQSPELKRFFNQQSLERGRLVGEVQSELVRLGEKDAKESGSVTAAMHRAWIDVKANVAGDSALLSSAEMGEDAAKKAYEKALEAELPGDIRTLVQRQSESVFAAHDQVRGLRDQHKAA